ncbi:MAG: acetate--CoA ligase family protein, partial [Alphaproteobacteria bacterium]|nr:acetate--CoA ligase family protein [Alphaproteobacteria bacterium]
IGLQTISGGIGVQLADAATKRGFDVKPLPEATQKKILDLIPFAGVNNPVDFTGQVLNERRFLEDSMRYVIDDADYDSHILYMASLPISQFTGALSLEIFTALRDQYPDELMLMSMIGTPEIRKQYEAVGYPCFEDHSLAVRAMAALRYFGEVFERGAPDAPPALPSNALSAPSNAVSEHEAKKIIASAGIPTARETLADSADACVAAWKEFAGPVVMKIASPDLPHKTEIGGVLLNIDGEEAVREGHATLLERARAAKPDARIDGVIVAEMIKGGVETVMGVVRDPVFGPVVMFGIGGVFVEVLKDITFRVAPFGVDEAYRMINEIRGRAMLDGVRGAPASDIGALADALSRLSVFAAANTETIDSIDVNPFIVLPKGAAAVDALIVPSEGG